MKDFTQYQEALEFKQLGFDEPCLANYYTLDGKTWKHADNRDYDFLDEFYNIGSKFTISAPTYSQAFRWFRKECGLESYIRANLFVDVPKTYQFYIDDNIDDVWYDTYEEAEIACLKKLIEIVKEK
jgi:hypothetical protein